MTPSIFEKLIELLMRFPGVGKKMAQRMAMQIVEWSPEEAAALAHSLTEVKETLRSCRCCFGLAEEELCAVCQNPHREPILCVVETPLDLLALEKAGIFRGKYHVLGGVYSPSDGVGLDHLHLAELKSRLQKEKIQEVILAMNPNPQGETTAYFVQEFLQDLPVKTTRIGRGLPMGSFIDYADSETLHFAFQGRSPLTSQPLPQANSRKR